ncbi:MAG: hypothetical protein QOJ69_732, partial [Actinomycetota bacterium]|nr:hypothetical protein [Actinomycetota bacterium]
IFNAVGLAREMVEAGMVGRVGEAVSPSKEPAAG